jgi:hypothetical protein
MIAAFSFAVLPSAWADDGLLLEPDPWAMSDPGQSGMHTSAVGGEFQVNSVTEGDQFAPNATGLNNGGFVAAWLHRVDSMFLIQAQLYDADGNKVGGEFTLGQSHREDASVELASLEGGGFAAVWEDNADLGNGSDMVGQVFDNNGQKVGNPFYAAGGRDETRPHVGALNDGSFVTVWASSDQGSADANITARRFNSYGSAISDEIEVFSTQIGNYDSDPHVVGLNDGGYYVVTDGFYGSDSNWDIVGRRFNAYNQTTSGVVELATGAGPQYYPVLESLGDGGFVLGWVEGVAQGLNDFYVKVFQSDPNQYSDNIKANIDPVYNSTNFFDLVSTGSNNSFVLVWDAWVDSDQGRNIFGQAYSSDGSRSGDAWQVNTTTAYDQRYPEAASRNSDGGYVVVWDSASNDGSGFGVFEQMY